MADGNLTVVESTNHFIKRIKDINPKYQVVYMVNPDAVEHAKELNKERENVKTKLATCLFRNN